MTATLTKPAQPSPSEQRFVQTGVSWNDFKSIQQGFANNPGVRLFYYDGELEILSTSPTHEIVKGNIGYLVEDYMVNIGQRFVATGSFSCEKVGTASAQPDESYCLGQAAQPIPDLAIEVVLTSGGPEKLKRYQILEVKEVWFWAAAKISVHRLMDDQYQQLDRSQWLPNLDLAKLAKCAAIEERFEAIQCFRN
ncbi:MAG: Uma2 family endonuclease [Leptolyngbyaceae cyanobacterium]